MVLGAAKETGNSAGSVAAQRDVAGHYTRPATLGHQINGLIVTSLAAELEGTRYSKQQLEY